MEKQPWGTNRVPEIRRVPYRVTKELGKDYEVNRRDTKEYEEAI